jgi:outer membrane protein assembly factor BamB
MKCLWALGTVAILSLTMCARAVDDANWPRFRGPNGTGISSDAIPAKWADDDFAWKIELPGEGHSSPVVWGNDVFVTVADEDAGKRSLVCVNARDGAIRWQHLDEFKTYKKHGENSFAYSTPAVDDKHIYLQWTTQESFAVVAVNHDGSEAWRTELGQYRTQHGGGGSPVVIGEVVVVNVDQDKGKSFIAGLDRTSGDVRWKTPRDSSKFSGSTPCLFQPKNAERQLIFTTHANGFTAVDPADGHIVWNLPDAFNDDRVVGSAVITDSLILGGAGEGGGGKGIVAVKPPAGTEGKPHVEYTLTDNVPYVPTPLIYRNRLLTWSDSGTVSCFEPATGKQIWTGKIKAGFFGSPVCADGKLYNVSKRGDVYVVDATGDEFKQLAKNSLGETSHATPAIAHGRMYIRTLTHLICIRGENEKPRTVGSVER